MQPTPEWIENRKYMYLEIVSNKYHLSETVNSKGTGWEKH